MKPSRSQLYDAFGELFYVIAMADGEVQDEEIAKIEQLLKGHPAAEGISWSFQHELKKQGSVEDAYNKALDTCKYYGQSEEYTFLFDALLQIAEASEGLSPEERKMLKEFQGTLKLHFLQGPKPYDEDGNLIP